MMKFKAFITESKETEWTGAMSEREMSDHLAKHKAKAAFTAMAKHKMFQDFHFGTVDSGNRLYKHKVDVDGAHHIKSAGTKKPNEHLHAIVSSRGKVYQINHNKITKGTDSEGKETKTTSRVKSYIAEDGVAAVPANAVGTQDKASVAGPPIRKKGITLLKRNNKPQPKSIVAP